MARRERGCDWFILISERNFVFPLLHCSCFLCLCRESVTSVSGTTVPLSSVLSPVSLAASTKIDSVFSPYFIPLISMAVHCEQLQLTLLHWAGNLSDGVAILEGYKVVPSHRGQEGHELLRLSVNNGRLFLRQMRNGSTRMKVCKCTA